MTDADIVTRLAREAGASELFDGEVAIMGNEGLARFAALVAEECAKICESLGDGIAHKSCAVAIRFRMIGPQTPPDGPKHIDDRPLP